jgi:hypothetical protein
MRSARRPRRARWLWRAPPTVRTPWRRRPACKTCASVVRQLCVLGHVRPSEPVGQPPAAVVLAAYVGAACHRRSAASDPKDLHRSAMSAAASHTPLHSPRRVSPTPGAQMPWGSWGWVRPRVPATSLCRCAPLAQLTTTPRSTDKNAPLHSLHPLLVFIIWARTPTSPQARLSCMRWRRCDRLVCGWPWDELHGWRGHRCRAGADTSIPRARGGARLGGRQCLLRDDLGGRAVPPLSASS